MISSVSADSNYEETETAVIATSYIRKQEFLESIKFDIKKYICAKKVIARMDKKSLIPINSTNNFAVPPRQQLSE